MTTPPRPKRYPPPEFPPRRAPAFARTPPAIFPVLLGLCGLAFGLMTWRLAHTALARQASFTAVP